MKSLEIQALKNTSLQKKGTGFFSYFIKNIDLILLASPVLVFLFIFKYLPMLGIILAFKDYRYDLGILKSKFIGFKNFEFLFKSSSFSQFTFNTIAYNVAFIVLTTAFAILFALLLNTLRSKSAIKVYQSAMFMPYFISFIVVGYIGLTFLNPTLGIMNRVLQSAGLEPVNWYSEPAPWVVIIPLVNLWKNLGYNVVIYYAALIGISQEYYEAADIDGASKLQQAWHISIPFLKPMMIVLILMSVGYIFRSDFGLFYMVPQMETSPNIYPTTDVIDTFIYRALKVNADFGMSSAAGFYQSVLGFVVLVVCDRVVKKFNEGNGLF